MDPAGWTASGFAVAEAVIITGVVVRRRRSEHGRRIRVHLMVGYAGPDTLEEETRTTGDDGSPDAVTPRE